MADMKAITLTADVPAKKPFLKQGP
ncbi:hypothetical protein Tcan_01776 [Toxocara canis]|uniref:Uncharacterized protein n=1 Tax=Toxocara canis TaxID=6265 RepID=A0A0B2UNN6_TOXCA|nr:hypothetical protein Tcan_01776 [Toxocara canis]